MTDQESISEADRSVSLFIDKADCKHSFLVTEVARLIRYWNNEGKAEGLRIAQEIFDKARVMSYEAEYKVEDRP